MRVLKVVDGLDVGGAEHYVLRVAPRLRELGIELEVCALDPGGPLREAFAAASFDVGGTPYAQRLRRSNTLVLAQTVASLRSRLRTGRFDAVHSYLFWSDLLGSVAGRLAGLRRVIVTRRGMHGWRYGEGRLLAGFNALANLSATEVVANSQGVLRDAVAHERWLPRLRTVIYSGIDPTGFEPAAPAGKAPLRIVSVGALHQRKGHDFAIAALHLLGQAGLDARLIIVGEGPEEAALRRQAAEAGLSRRLTITGRSEDPRPHLSQAHLFLLASRQEGFSNALLEAMACALPAVVTDVGGNAEALGGAGGGRVVPPGDPEALAAAVLDLVADRSQLRRAGTANRERMLAEFTLDMSARRLRDWYLRPPGAAEDVAKRPAG